MCVCVYKCVCVCGCVKRVEQNIYIYIYIERERERESETTTNGLVSFGLSCGISTPERLFNAKIRFICKCLIIIITTTISNLRHQSFFLSTLFICLCTHLYGVQLQSNTNNLHTAKKFQVHLSNIGIGLVWFRGILTNLGYLRLNPLYEYIYNI